MKDSDVQREISRMTKNLSMNHKLEDLMYSAGLTAQGCWDELDEYDRGAILTLARLIVQECIQVCGNRVGNSDYNTGRMHCASDIRDHFGVE